MFPFDSTSTLVTIIIVFILLGKKTKKKSDDYKTMGVDGIRLYYNTI